MPRFASLLLPALAFGSAAAIVPSGRVALSDKTSMKQAGSHEDAVRRQRKNKGKHELAWTTASGKVEQGFDQAIYVVDGVSYRRAGGWSCAASSGAEAIDSDVSAKVNVTPTQCLGECNKDPACSCTRYSRYYGMKCWKMKNCPSEGHRLAECDRADNFDTYIRQGPTPPPTPAVWEAECSDCYCDNAQLTHRHGQTPAGTYASQAACQELCASAPACKFYQWRHDANANSKYTCATFSNCDNPRPFTDGDGGRVWKKPFTHTFVPSATGFVDLGMGRCCVDDHTPLCSDAVNIFRRDDAASCEQLCAGDPQCFGYSTTNATAGAINGGHCWLWTEQHLRFGGATQQFEGSHCNVKTCVTTSSCATCTDTSGWDNGFGFGCHSYQVHFCENGKLKAGQEHWGGDGMKNPERNCCSCGGGLTDTP